MQGVLTGGWLGASEASLGGADSRRFATLIPGRSFAAA